MSQIEQAEQVRDVLAPRRGRRKVILDAPVTAASFWRDRSHSAIVSRLGTHHGRNLADIRQFVMIAGKLVPTPRGFTLPVLRLPDLHKAIVKAMREARKLGLLPPDDGAGP
jgi:hypothetical protein